MNVLVDLHSGDVGAETLTREITEQCSPKIQNIMNFLPEDKGLGIDTAGAWPGMVDQAQQGYEEIGKEITVYGFRDGSAVRANTEEETEEDLLDKVGDFGKEVRIMPDIPVMPPEPHGPPPPPPGHHGPGHGPHEHHHEIMDMLRRLEERLQRIEERLR